VPVGCVVVGEGGSSPAPGEPDVPGRPTCETPQEVTSTRARARRVVAGAPLSPTLAMAEAYVASLAQRTVRRSSGAATPGERTDLAARRRRGRRVVVAGWVGSIPSHTRSRERPPLPLDENSRLHRAGTGQARKGKQIRGEAFGQARPQEKLAHHHVTGAHAMLEQNCDELGVHRARNLVAFHLPSPWPASRAAPDASQP
jgi:hypothetical protein